MVDPEESSPLQKLLLAAGPLSVAVACGYVAGYIVTNSHLAQHQTPDFDVLRARYLSAAVLVAFLSILPCVIVPRLLKWVALSGWTFATALKRTVAARSGYRVLPWGALLAIPAGAYLLSLAPKAWEQLIYYLSLNLTSPGRKDAAFQFLVALGIAVLIATSTAPALTGNWKRWFESIRVVALLAAFPLAVLALWFVGVFIYPIIPPQLGGGAGQGALVTLADGNFADYARPPRSDAGDSTAMFALIVDQDNGRLTFATCLRPSATAAPRFRSVTVSRDAVQRIVSLPFTAPMAFGILNAGNDLCT